ncbi:hypothetical protein FHT19_002792 [Novosphingobium sp. SG919]|nr:hypothetical protein [Novosphingobium sp. SG919]
MTAMATVFVLHHVRQDDVFGDDAKLIGVYTTDAGAKNAQSRLAMQPGFREYPAGFHIDEYPLDKDHWTEGFVTTTRINMPLEHEATENWAMVLVQDLHDGRYEVLGPMPKDEHWRFRPGSIVRCETVIENGEECLVASSMA